ncbi:MAG: macrolide ABC transporter ATP-binding protein [Nitrospirae bacterium GWC2_56_14]|nr:MAG: macrolide ABC transporter ATP-binding protein [Nitrospirae bacterium GWC2_56_14]
MLELSHITKIYRMGGVDITVLSDVSLKVQPGELIAIMGPSGSGKSTIMNMLGCLDRPTSGSYRFEGREISSMTDDELASIRNVKIGFVFQTFNLLPRFSALKNVEVPLIYSGVPARLRKERAMPLLQQVGLFERMDHKPTELSGGQQQRVAIARALVNHPPLLLADEPTGNLDSRSGEEILKILIGLNQQGVTVIIVTHDQTVAARCKRIISVKDGQIIDDRGQP